MLAAAWPAHRHARRSQLLNQAGFSVAEIPEGHLCCGSAGTYNLLQPELSDELRERKLRNIASVTPDVIATGNIGCMMQLAGSADAPFVHTVELLDWATGGRCPRRSATLKDSGHEIETLVEMAKEGLLVD